MADNNFIVQSVKFYEFGKNLLWLSIVHSKEWNRYSLDITRKLTYTKDGKTKEGYCSTYLNVSATKALVEQLPLTYQLAKSLQANQGVEIYNLFSLIFEICYTFQHRSGASDRKRLDRWSVRRHCRSWRHRSLEYRQLCHGRMPTHSRWSKSARILESETELGPCMLYPPAQFQADVLKTPESRSRKAVACLKKTRIKSTTMAVKPILERINAPWVPNGRYQKLQPPALTERKQSECPSPTTSSTAVAATWTSAPDATLTTPTMNCISTTPSSSDLTTLIYATFILDHLMSYSNLKINLHKNLFRKFFYPQLISFLENAL